MYIKKIYVTIALTLAFSAGYAQINQEEQEGDSSVFDRYDYEFDRIKDPALGYVPGRQLLNAKQAKIAMQSQRNATSATPFNWTERGPRNDVTGPSNGNTRPGMGGTSGRVRVIWQDLSDASGETVWVGSASGGLWKGTNISGGTTWTPVNDLFDNLAITAFCQDPVNKDIMFFGTGEKNPSGDAVKGGGIWRSIDHGVTWGPMPGTENYGNIAKMACDAAGNLYVASVMPYIPNLPAGSKSGVYRYLKLAFSWSDITPAGLSDLVPELELSSTGRLHVSCGFLGAPGAGYRYTDNPATVTAGSWTAPATSFPTQYNVDMASKGDTLYALTANAAYETPVIYKSTNGGANWAPTTTSPPTARPYPQSLDDLSSGQGWYCIGMAVDPNDAQKVIVGSLNCYRTVNGGATWSQISKWVGTSGQYVHADQHVVTWGNNNLVLIGSDGGVHYSNNGGVSIVDRNLGLRIKQFYSIAVHPTTTDYFLGGTQDNGTHQLTSPGMNISTEVTGGDGGFVHIDQDQPQFQWGAYTGNTFYRSINNGSSWTKVQDPANNGRFINPSDYDDINNIMYCAGNAGTFVRWNNPQTGTTFTSVSITGVGGANGKVSAVKVSPYSNNTVYAALSTYPNAPGAISPRLIKITNAHATPSFASVAAPFAGIANATVSCVELGTSEDDIIVCLSNYGVNNVWVTTNGGTNWQAIDGNLPDMPVRWAMFYPGDNTKAIIATETGIWQTVAIDGTSTVWDPEPNFPNVRTDMIQYRRNDRLLAVATHGRGIFTAKLDPDSVKNLQATSITNASATIQWDSTADALTYDVDYKLSSTSSWTSFATASTDTFALLTGLKNNTAYDVRVRANWGPGVSSDYSTYSFSTINFAVTSPNTNISVPAASALPVTWSGSASGISPNVKISLSTNGGATYPIVLTPSTANDNSETLTLPNISSTTCRIKIESVDTVYFFDVSDTNFTITPKPIICKRADIQIYKRDTSFTSIASDDNGFVYAGTQTRGLFRLENNQFKNYSHGLNGLIPWKRTWIRQMMVANNQLWVAHSGYISPIGVEVDNYRYGGVETINVLNGPGDRVNRRGQRIINIDLTIAGPPTRNTMGILVDTLTGKVWSISDYADSVSYPELYNYTARYWYKTGGIGIMNPAQTNFFRNEQGYPAPFSIGVGTNMAGTESNSIGKRKGNVSITATPTEILTTCRGYQAVGDTVFKAGVMRYNRLTGAYIGKYDQTNTGLPFGLTNTTAAPPAIYTDAKNRVWLALGGNRLAVMDTSGWHYIGVPGSLAGGGTIQPNAISGDRRGVVYFGTDAGLLVFDNNKDTSGIASYTKDSSYCIYTTTQGLPSNYIRGTHVDRSGNIWLATGSGVCRMQRGDLLMYNLLPQPAANYITNSDAKRTVVAGFDPDFENTDTIRIAADGASATMFKWQGKDPAKLKALIKEGNAPADFGSLTVVHRSVDSFAVQYKHPEQLSGAFAAQGKRDLTLQLFDTTFAPPKLIIDVKFTVVRPPILCLHGIWSSGDMYNDFKRYLLDSAGYKDFMVGTPSYPNDVSFTANQFVARDEAAKLLQQCADNNFSAGKVDIVSHSMGGILSRIFLQSTGYDFTINKLITVNTPHSGSQLADLVRSSPALQAVVNNLLGNNTDNGAMDDLRVTQDGIRVLLNGAANLNKNKVPSHAITSRYTDLQVYEVLVDAALTIASYVPALGKVAKVAKTMLAVLKYAAYSGTTCNTNETIHECLRNKIYEEDNDLAVALSSQRGGLSTSAISYYDNYSHNSIMDQSPVFNRLNVLLKAPTNDGAFTTNGYNPPLLNYNASLRMPSSPSTETVDIASPVSGASYAAGQSLTVDIVGSTNIQKHLVAIGNETLGAKYYNNVSRNFSFNYNIPLDAIGKIYLVAIGFDNLGKVTFDTAFINVGVPAGVTLDSIRISDKRKLKVYQADSIRLTINAFYSDTVRDISNMPGVGYIVDDVNVKASAVAFNYIVGLLEGYDFFRATWQGKTDTGYIQVLPKPLGPGTGVIPVTLTSFTGKLVGNAVQLKWNTAQEINASHFEVERSADGINFSYIGQVQAVGQSNGNSNYGFNDLQFKPGANYYRLKQVDVDGRFTYSIVVLIRVKKGNQPDVLIFPNPAQKYVTVNITEGQHPQWNLQVLNMMGQPVLRHTIPANQNNERIALGQLAKGVYTVGILSASGERIYNGKLVVQ